MTEGMTGVGVDPALGVGMTSETAEGTAVLTGVAGPLPSRVHHMTCCTAQCCSRPFCACSRWEASYWYDEHLQTAVALL